MVLNQNLDDSRQAGHFFFCEKLKNNYSAQDSFCQCGGRYGCSFSKV